MDNIPVITDEDLATAEEAHRISRLFAPGHSPGPSAIAAALVRTGRKPVDPDLILARKVCAELDPNNKIRFLSGALDGWFVVLTAIAAIKAARAEHKG
jgi:hypothetical protein